MKTFEKIIRFILIFSTVSLCAMIVVGWVLNGLGMGDIAWTITWWLLGALVVSLFIGGNIAMIDTLKQLGGRLNPALNRDGEKCAGWVFPKTKEADLRAALHVLE